MKKSVTVVLVLIVLFAMLIHPSMEKGKRRKFEAEDFNILKRRSVEHMKNRRDVRKPHFYTYTMLI